MVDAAVHMAMARGAPCLHVVRDNIWCVDATSTVASYRFVHIHTRSKCPDQRAVQYHGESNIRSISLTSTKFSNIDGVHADDSDAALARNRVNCKPKVAVVLDCAMSLDPELMLAIGRSFREEFRNGIRSRLLL